MADAVQSSQDRGGVSRAFAEYMPTVGTVPPSPCGVCMCMYGRREMRSLCLFFLYCTWSVE